MSLTTVVDSSSSGGKVRGQGHEQAHTEQFLCQPLWVSLTEQFLQPKMARIEFGAHSEAKDHQSDRVVWKEYALCI